MIVAGVLRQVGLVETSVDALRERGGVEVPELQGSWRDLADLGRPERHALLVDTLLDARTDWNCECASVTACSK